MTITISADHLQEILTETTFPIISFAEFPYTEEQVKNVFIWKAMREYYKWFPLEDIQEVVIGNQFDIAFPDAETFNVKDCKLVTNAVSTGVPTGNPFSDNAQIMSINAPKSNRYGTGNNYNQHLSYHNKRAEYEGLKNSFNAFRFYVDHNTKSVKGYSNLAQARLNITWAKYSTDYNSIRFDRVEEVNKLSASEILRALGSLYQFQSTELENEMNADYMIERSEQLREEVLTSWKAKTKAVLMRG